jgi:hypothetical protein
LGTVLPVVMTDALVTVGEVVEPKKKDVVLEPVAGVPVVAPPPPRSVVPDDPVVAAVFVAPFSVPVHEALIGQQATFPAPSV